MLSAVGGWSNTTHRERRHVDTSDGQAIGDQSTDHPKRTDGVLRTSDFVDGPLSTDDFTGGAVDIEHLAVGTLKLEYFVGDAFEELRVDEPTTVERHTASIEPTRSGTIDTEISSSLGKRRVFSTCIYEEFEREFKRDDRKNLVALYVHDDDLDKAFAELKDRADLSLVRQYRDPVATTAPVEYFERYRELLVPFAAGDPGRRHHREIADHLEEMRGLVPEARFEEFVDFLKDKHSNRPAFLDELEKAGF